MGANNAILNLNILAPEPSAHAVSAPDYPLESGMDIQPDLGSE